MADLKAGDVVQLKSGGPEMTITDIGTDEITKSPTVWRVWFVKTKRETGAFPTVTVNKVR